MSGTVDGSELFDADVLAATAAEYELDDEFLAEVVARHQESMAALPGIENLAYEWRKQYESPLVDRTGAAYYFAVPEWVWSEFGDALEIGDAVREALADVHRRTVVARTDAPPHPTGSVTYVVLDRSFDDGSTEA